MFLGTRMDGHGFFYENIEKHISEIRVVLVTAPLTPPKNTIKREKKKLAYSSEREDFI